MLNSELADIVTTLVIVSVGAGLPSFLTWRSSRRERWQKVYAADRRRIEAGRLARAESPTLRDVRDLDRAS